MNKINALPIILDRKATIYEGDDEYFCDNDEVILCSDGTNVEYWFPPFFNDHRRPYNNIQISLNITADEFMELTQGVDTYVDLILIAPNKVSVFITTQHDAIYDEVHTI